MIKNNNNETGTLNCDTISRRNPSTILNSGSREYSRRVSSYLVSKGKVSHITIQPRIRTVPNSMYLKPMLSDINERVKLGSDM